jgi:DNA-binding NarL/FixJ family response regulator
MKEIWLPIPNYEGLYEISNLGRVRRLRGKDGTILKPFIDTHGYLIVTLSKNSQKKLIRIHRLVALIFLPNPENKAQVNHIDGNKFNNRIDNLEWSTKIENQRHAERMGLAGRRRALDDDIGQQILTLVKAGMPNGKIATQLNICYTTVWRYKKILKADLISV